MERNLRTHLHTHTFFCKAFKHSVLLRFYNAPYEDHALIVSMFRRHSQLGKLLSIAKRCGALKLHPKEDGNDSLHGMCPAKIPF